MRMSVTTNPSRSPSWHAITSASSPQLAE